MKLNKWGVIFALQNLKELREGEPIEQHLSYLERPLATGGGSGHAPFEASCLLIAEVENRLKKCGRDGFLCKVHYALEESPGSLARDIGILEEEVERGIKTALKYVSYKWPKVQSYSQYKSRNK